jgi:hypothetical protein
MSMIKSAFILGVIKEAKQHDLQNVVKICLFCSQLLCSGIFSNLMYFMTSLQCLVPIYGIGML